MKTSFFSLLKICKVCLIYWITAGSLVLYAQTSLSDQISDINGTNSGLTAALFLQLPANAQSLALGSCATPAQHNAFDLETQTASSASLDRYSFGITHLEWLMSTRLEYLCAAFPVLDVGTFGVYSRMFTLGQFLYARDINENISKPSYGEFLFGASFARQIMPSIWNAGISVDYLISNLDKTQAQGFGVNASTCGTFSFVQATLSVSHLGMPLQYTANPSPLPLTLAATITLDPFSKSKNKLVDLEGCVGVRKIGDQPLSVGASLQTQFLSMLSFSCGYDYPLGSNPTLEGISGGAGFTYDHYGVQFGYQNRSTLLGSTYALSATAQLEELTPKTADDLYKVAERHFQKNRYEVCTYYAYKALALDPNLWKAHALLARVAALKRRSQGLEVAILYTGNTHGAFSPQAGATETIGGLARAAQALKMQKSSYPYRICINTGNNLAQGSHALKPAVLDQYYAAVGFDALMLGSGEYQFGLKQFHSSARHSTNLFVSTNTKGLPLGRTIPKKIVSVDKYKFCFLSVLGTQDTSSGPDSGSIEPLVSALQEQLSKPDVQNCTGRILIIHDSYERIALYAKALSSVSAIICGSLHHTISTPLLCNGIPVVSAGDSGRAIGALVFRFDPKGGLISINNALVPLRRSIPEDTTLQRIVSEAELRIACADAGIDSLQSRTGTRSGTFPFISDRSGSAQLYLKVTASFAEFPLTYGTATISAPRMHMGAGKILYLATAPNSTITSLHLLNTNGSARTIVGSNYNITNAEFSPNGQFIYACASNDRGKGMGIFRVQTQGTYFEPIVPFVGSTQKDIALSPDGNLLAFASNRDKSWQIYYGSSNGEHPIRITNDNSDHWLPHFSPNNSKIAYLSKTASIDDQSDLWIYDMKVGRTSQVTMRAGVQSYCWLSDGETILYSFGINQLDLATVNLSSGVNQRVIPADSTKHYSEIDPVPILWKNSLRYLYTRLYPDSSRALFWVKPDGSDDCRIVFDAENSWIQ